MLCLSIIHQKPPWEKMDDMTQPCVDIASLKTLYEKPKGKKTHTKKRVQYDVFNKLLIREARDSPPETCKPFIPMYSTHMKCGV